MPDWSYHPLKKLLLNRMRAEYSRRFIHRSMSTIASLPWGQRLIQFLGHTKPAPELHQMIDGISFSAPIGFCGAIDPQLQGTKAFQYLGFGLLELGPIVIRQPDNVIPPIIDPLHNQVSFSINSEKVILQHAIHHLKSIKLSIPILATIDISVTVEEAKEIITQIEQYADGFIIPASLIAQLQLTSITVKPIYASIANNNQHIEEFLIEQDVLTHINGVVLHAPVIESNSYLVETKDSLYRLAESINEVRRNYPQLTVISSGSVHSPDDALLLQQSGSHLILVSSGIVTAGPGLVKRSYELMLDRNTPPLQPQSVKWSILFSLSIFIGGLLALIFSLTGVILPYDEHFIGLTREQIYLLNPNLLYFMAHDRMALAGTMISASILYYQLARHGIRLRMHWSKIAFHSAAIAGFLGILLFIGYGYFDWLHGLFWLVLTPIYILSLREGKSAIHYARSSYGSNSKKWRLSNYGQLMFVILGAALLLGGIVISIIGITGVFIDTDLAYICMSPEMINQISNQLIPVIAHDRAGFGGALISVGLLVLMLSLWGYRKGEEWVWNTFAVGALPAFITGIGTHIYIGYTTFIHLLPVYFLVLIYIAGLILSYPFLRKRND